MVARGMAPTPIGTCVILMLVALMAVVPPVVAGIDVIGPGRNASLRSVPTADGPGAVRDIEQLGAVSTHHEPDHSTCVENTRVLQSAMQGLLPGETLLVPSGKTFWLQGGIEIQDISDVVIQIDGVLSFTTNRKEWPVHDNTTNVKECLSFTEIHNVTFTSTQREHGGGTLDGNGAVWWGYINYYLHKENRPRLFLISRSTNLVVENILLKNSPYWTFYANDVADLIIRWCTVDARRSKADTHDLNNLGAFNTDGFDVAGRDIHIHDCTVWNDDDTVCVKEMNGNGKYAQCSENMLFERINASGVGLTVGSIGPSSAHTCVRNITFRDIDMHNPFKGIYMKSRPGGPGETGEITEVLYERINIYHPTQWAIWLGPQQAIYSGECQLWWPYVPGSKCPVGAGMTWSNITLKDVFVDTPVRSHSPGVILGSAENPMKNVVFDNVVVKNPGLFPFFKKYYKCRHTEGIARGGTYPVPPCFKQE